MKNKAYVSDFTQFMDDYLGHHPEVMRDQIYGYSIYWGRDFGRALQE